MVRCVSRELLCALAVFSVVATSQAQASDDAGTESTPTGPASFTQFQSAQWSLQQVLRAVTDMGGERSGLEQAGLTFTFTYYGDAFANPVGGVKQGPGYDGRFGIIIDGDLDKLAGWSGATFHASIHQIHGTQFGAENPDNLMTVSGIEAPPSTRLSCVENPGDARPLSVTRGNRGKAIELRASARRNEDEKQERGDAQDRDHASAGLRISPLAARSLSATPHPPEPHSTIPHSPDPGGLHLPSVPPGPVTPSQNS